MLAQIWRKLLEIIIPLIAVVIVILFVINLLIEFHDQYRPYNPESPLYQKVVTFKIPLINYDTKYVKNNELFIKTYDEISWYLDRIGFRLKQLSCSLYSQKKTEKTDETNNAFCPYLFRKDWPGFVNQILFATDIDQKIHNANIWLNQMEPLKNKIQKESENITISGDFEENALSIQTDLEKLNFIIEGIIRPQEKLLEAKPESTNNSIFIYNIKVRFWLSLLQAIYYESNVFLEAKQHTKNFNNYVYWVSTDTENMNESNETPLVSTALCVVTETQNLATEYNLANFKIFLDATIINKLSPLSNNAIQLPKDGDWRAGNLFFLRGETVTGSNITLVLEYSMLFNQHQVAE